MMAQGCCFKNPSYFFLADAEQKHGFHYFTYFTQYNNQTELDGTEYWEAAFFITNCIFSFLLNILVLITIAQNKELRSVCNIFICNMTITDFLYGLVGPVLAMVRLNGDWNLGLPMCHLVFYIQSVCGCVVCWSIAAVSVDRYLHIVHPMKTKLTITARRSAGIIAFIWFIAIASMSPLGIYFQVMEIPLPYSNHTAHVCTLFWPEDEWYIASTMFVIDITVISFILPGGLVLWSYSKCIKQIGSSRQSLAMRMDSLGSDSSVVDMKKRRALRDFRVMRTLVILFSLFLLAWGPFFCTLPVILIDIYSQSTLMTSEAFVWTVGLAQFNSVVNPVAYGLSMRSVRRRIIQRMRALW